MTYYNDNDPFICSWLRKLTETRLLSGGVIDGRSIKNVKGVDLVDYDRVHLFAGIGGWDYALQLAGWSSGPVWTGSCPCQPFSKLGLGREERDERHLWPEMRRLLDECHPPIVFGEQVAGKLGRKWISRVRSDLESLGYAVGVADLCAASVSAPHIRQRLYWVGFANGKRPQPRSEATTALGQGNTVESAGMWAEYRAIRCYDEKQRRISVEPFLFPVVDGIPNRVGILRGVGNSIVPQVAARFIKSAMEAYLEV